MKIIPICIIFQALKWLKGTKQFTFDDTIQLFHLLDLEYEAVFARGHKERGEKSERGRHQSEQDKKERERDARRTVARNICKEICQYTTYLH